jgi:hypothetical protein
MLERIGQLYGIEKEDSAAGPGHNTLVKNTTAQESSNAATTLFSLGNWLSVGF